MEKKQYQSPMTDIIKIVTNTSLLDWSAPKDDGGGGNIPEGKHGFFDDEDDDMDMNFHVDVWQ